MLPVHSICTSVMVFNILIFSYRGYLYTRVMLGIQIPTALCLRLQPWTYFMQSVHIGFHELRELCPWSQNLMYPCLLFPPSMFFLLDLFLFIFLSCLQTEGSFLSFPEKVSSSSSSFTSYFWMRLTAHQVTGGSEKARWELISYGNSFAEKLIN